jgi:hypothetical protein
MVKSLKHRYKTGERREIHLSKSELSHGFAKRSNVGYYRVGEVRKAMDRQNCSFGVKIMITAISEFNRQSHMARITFRKVAEPRKLYYIVD